MSWHLETLDRVAQAMSEGDDPDHVLTQVLRVLEGAELVSPCHPEASSFTLRTPDEVVTIAGTPHLRDELRRALAHDEPLELQEGLGVRVGDYLLRTRWMGDDARGLLAALRPRLGATVRRLETIRKQARHLELVQAHAGVGYWECDLDTGEVNWSEATHRLLGVAEASLEALQARLHPEDVPRQQAVLEAALREGSPYSLNYRILHPSGEYRVIRSAGHVYRDASGRPIRKFGTVQDVTEENRAERELKLFRTLLDYSNDCIEVVDPSNGRFLDVNRQACIAHGYTREEYLQLSVGDVDAVVAERPWAEVIRLNRLQGRSVFESKHVRKDGSVFPVEVSCAHIELERPYLLAVVRDLTERKASHKLLNAVVEGTNDVVFVKDLAGRYLMLNAAACAVLGKTIEEVLGRDDSNLFPPEAAAALMAHDSQVLTTGEAISYEQLLTLPNGEQRYFLCTTAAHRDPAGTIVGVVGMARDITDRKRLEEQLLQSQKMEAIGQLAGGIAHDFNNLLTVINSYSELLLQSGEGDPEMLGAIHEAGQKAANLTGRLLAFSRKQVLMPTVVDFNELLPRLVSLLHRVIGEHIELSLVPGPGLARARVDVSQFEQAIVNLAVNARDAMPDGGRLTIELGNEGKFVHVALTDTGHGMDEKTKAHLFEPFFTTKEPGQGTGLGLAMVYGFVRQSGGCIEVQSKPGQGTTFRLFLPRAEEVVSPPKEAPRTDLPSGDETVLLVEDEAAVRMMARKVLEKCGYRVIEAGNGQEALQVAHAHEGELHLVVTDLVMPKMCGRQFASILSEERPELPFLFISGYPRGQTLSAEDAFLQKPFGPAELAGAVREVLERGAKPLARDGAIRR